MKRQGLVSLAVSLLLAGYASAQAAPSSHKTIICHATKSATKPYKRIVTTKRSVIRAHSAGHHGDIVNPAGGTCPSRALSWSRGGRPISATLGPSVPVPPPAGPIPIARGAFVARSNIGQGRICWKLTVQGLNDVTASHIHYGTGPKAKQIAVPLTLPAPFNGTATGCADAARALVKQILVRPQNFYVNVHTTTYPAGAISGVLKKGAPKKH